MVTWTLFFKLNVQYRDHCTARPSHIDRLLNVNVHFVFIRVKSTFFQINIHDFGKSQHMNDVCKIL